MPKARINKYIYETYIQGMYDGKWCDETAVAKKEARSLVKTYRTNCPGRSFRIINRRELNPERVKMLDTLHGEVKETKTQIKPNWRFIKRDETEFWLPSWNARKLGTKLVATYAYNANSHTYCCSLTPAYWMVYLGTEAFPEQELTDRWQLVDIMESESDEQSTYFNCSDVDRMKSEALPYEIDVDREDFEEGEIGDSEYDRKVEDCIRENFQANPGACTWRYAKIKRFIIVHFSEKYDAYVLFGTNWKEYHYDTPEEALKSRDLFAESAKEKLGIEELKVIAAECYHHGDSVGTVFTEEYVNEHEVK